MAQLEFFFDFVSPYTYLASHQLRYDKRYHQVDVVWTPMLLGGVFKAVGNRPPAELAPKGAYMLLDLQRLAHHYGVPFSFPASFPINTLMPMRGAAALLRQKSPRYLAYCGAMFDAYWGRGEDISDPEVWAGIASSTGVDPLELRKAIETPEVKEALKASTDRAVNIGAFGAPTFLADGEMFWGFDRMFLVDKHLGLAGSR